MKEINRSVTSQVAESSALAVSMICHFQMQTTYMLLSPHASYSCCMVFQQYEGITQMVDLHTIIALESSPVSAPVSTLLFGLYI